MRKIEGLAFSKSWESDFQKEAYLIKNSLKNKNNIIPLIHIGSTSVKGLKAKPIIDMLLVVNDN
ncbi:GrpB family protein [Oceanobacillus sp. J11TS1]|uniref:GrpB family protein n=1 Tax=Oceanobacillus sp. J11TS1 TaxID=2807191 RepID=UPI001AFF4EF9|nr:GrpB family protein [Oceanobacillus sp. J11TS1]GIO22475.1 hypothetical protein J11TS1_10560 [Oceanobacillus sp. J11TS1]